MKTPHNKPLLCVTVLLSLLSGCMSLERSYPDKRYFVLEASNPGAQADAKGGGILEVANVRVSPRYEGRSFIYRTTDVGFEADFYNEFLVSPAALISEEVRGALTRARLFQYVVSPFSQLQPTHVLEAAVNGLYGDFRDASSPKAVLEMEFFLGKESPSRAQVVLQKRYFKTVKISGHTAEALVRGWDQALGEILTSLVTDLKAAKF
jgi:uncharacterized lipoprotein YmbA